MLHVCGNKSYHQKITVSVLVMQVWSHKSEDLLLDTFSGSGWIQSRIDLLKLVCMYVVNYAL